MKLNFKTLSMMMVGAALALTSCSSEEPLNGNQDNAQGEGIGYMAFTISTDQTRAGDSEYGSDNTDGNDVTVGDEIFNDGNANEYAICPNTKANLAIFFTSDDKVFGASYLTPFDHKVDSDNHVTGSHEGQDSESNNTKYPEQFYTYVTRWNNTDHDNAKPAKVLVLLNVDPGTLSDLVATAQELKDEKTALTQILAQTKKTANFGIYNYNSTDYFSMSNSVYVNNGSVICATDIDEKVYPTPEEALEDKVVVYVERMLAKFELTFAGEDGSILRLTSNSKNGILIKPSTTSGEAAKLNYVAEYTGKEDNLDFPVYQPVAWRVFVGNWGINAVEPENYYFKNIKSDSEYFDAYNSFPLHRSYWAESVNYNTTENFPTQYRPTTNEDGGNDPNKQYFGIATPNSFATGNGQTNTDGTNKETTLTYYSFNHFSKRGVYKYAPERTYGDKAVKGLAGYGPYRFGSHFLVGAQLVLWDEETDKPLDPKARDYGRLYMDNVKDLWAAYNFYFGDEKSYIRYAYHRMVSQFADGRLHTLKAGTTTKEYQTKGDQAVLYVDKEMTKPLKVKDAAEFFTTVAAHEIHGDGKRMIALKDEEKLNGKKLYYKKVEKVEVDGKMVEMDVAVELTPEDLNIIAFNLTESASRFFEGKMYYAIPVQHNQGKSNVENRVAVIKDGEYEVGQFGTVRNHWYSLKINKIGSVGTPVEDPNQPIIPDPEDIYNIALEIVVLPWHKIDNGSVDL